MKSVRDTANTGEERISAHNSARDGRRRVFVTIYMAGFALLFGLYAFQLWYHATRTSTTIDEPAHILAGHRYWQCGDYGINPEHPPLLKLLATAPLNSRTFVEPGWDCGSRITSRLDSFAAGNLFLAQNGVYSVLVPARLAAALMSLLLAAVVLLAAWEMFGRAEALIALALLAFEPNLIAHGSLVTTDMALAATALATVYALYRYRNRPSWARLLAAGLAFGLLLASKHSAVVILPILFALYLADFLFFRRPAASLPKQIFRQTASFAAFLLIGLLLLWSCYGFRYYSLPQATESTISISDYMRTEGRPGASDTLSAKIIQGIGRARVFPESYVVGLADIVATGNRNTWLFGRIYPTGRWFYFPLAFAVKTSVALLLLLPAGLLALSFRREKRRELMFLLVPPLLYFAVSLTSGINIGVRHILPVYPFFIVVAAAGAVAACRKYPVLRYALIALLLFHAATAYRTAPLYLAFANDFAGGPQHTHRIFSDSNVETGQSLKLVNEYLAREKIGDCWFAAFGHATLVSVTQPCRVLPSGQRFFASPTIAEPVPPVIEGAVLLSVNELPPRGGNEYLPIAQSTPVAQIGGNVFVYRGRFEVPLAAAVSHATRAGQFTRLNRLEEAVGEGRKAVELGLDDPRPHLALGVALARAGRKDEARRELEAASRLVDSNPALFFNVGARAQQELRGLD
jgi:4-amino-4-deoxy-L-arabinose transferase-like glycosyltransferase